jgi:hypothetical protein
MRHPWSRRTVRPALVLAVAAFAALPAQSRVTRIVIDETSDIAAQPGYEQLTGRAFGELDPANVHNRLITDITWAALVNQAIDSDVLK